jgi:hypothetical protein
LSCFVWDNPIPSSNCIHMGHPFPGETEERVSSKKKKLKREMDKLPAKPRLASAAAVSGGSHSGVRGREVLIPTPDAMPPRRRTACPALCRRAAFPIDDSLRSVDGELIEFTSDHDGTDPLCVPTWLLWTCMFGKTPTNGESPMPSAIGVAYCAVQAGETPANEAIAWVVDGDGCLVMNSGQCKSNVQRSSKFHG